MAAPDCKNCPYRKLLAREFDIHVWAEDCDRYETERCCGAKMDLEV